MCIRDSPPADFHPPTVALARLAVPRTVPVAVQLDALGVAPVSYTHLDVYKRQRLETGVLPNP